MQECLSHHLSCAGTHGSVSSLWQITWISLCVQTLLQTSCQGYQEVSSVPQSGLTRNEHTWRHAVQGPARTKVLRWQHLRTAAAWAIFRSPTHALVALLPGDSCGLSFSGLCWDCCSVHLQAQVHAHTLKQTNVIAVQWAPAVGQATPCCTWASTQLPR